VAAAITASTALRSYFESSAIAERVGAFVKATTDSAASFQLRRWHLPCHSYTSLETVMTTVSAVITNMVVQNSWALLGFSISIQPSVASS
jgi:prophage DNA circulation protein